MIIHIGLPRTGTTFLQKEIFAKTNCDNFLSDENLFGDITNTIDTFFSQMEGIRNLYDDVRIILVLRDKEKWLKSIYTQYVKEGGYLKYDEWYKRFDKDFIDWELLLDYLKTFNTVITMNYEDMLKDKKRFVKEFCQFAQINEPTWEDKKHNISWDERIVEANRILNAVFFWYPKTLRFWYPDQFPPRFIITRMVKLIEGE